VTSPSAASATALTSTAVPLRFSRDADRLTGRSAAVAPAAPAPRRRRAPSRPRDHASSGPRPRSPSVESRLPHLDTGATPWEPLLHGEEGLTALANLPTLQAMLATLPMHQLHLPHAAPSIAELFPWWSPKRSRQCLQVEIRLVAAQALVAATLEAALVDTAARASAPPSAPEPTAASSSAPTVAPPSSAPLRAAQAYALWALFPSLMLRHPGGETSILKALVHRLNLWQGGAWAPLFAEAGLFQADTDPSTGAVHGSWSLGKPGSPTTRPDAPLVSPPASAAGDRSALSRSC
jgi:hypothetical protein